MLPLLDPIECLPVLDVDPSPVQCALFSPCCSIVLHSGLLIGKMLWSISLCLGSHGSYICSSLILVHLFVPCPQGVSPPIYSLQLCFSFAAGRFSTNLFSSALFLLCRRAFLHQFGLDYHPLIMMDSNVLVCGPFFKLPPRLIMMDNNVRGRVVLAISNFLSLTPCHRLQLVFAPAVIKAIQLVLYIGYAYTEGSFAKMRSSYFLTSQPHQACDSK